RFLFCGRHRPDCLIVPPERAREWSAILARERCSVLKIHSYSKGLNGNDTRMPDKPEFPVHFFIWTNRKRKTNHRSHRTTNKNLLSILLGQLSGWYVPR